MVGRQFTSVESWSKMGGSAPWVSGQASGLNPGGRSATTKRRQKTSHARGKKVSRPRVKKRHNPDTKPK